MTVGSDPILLGSNIKPALGAERLLGWCDAICSSRQDGAGPLRTLEVRRRILKTILDLIISH